MRELIARHKALRMAISFFINVLSTPVAAIVSLYVVLLVVKYVIRPGYFLADPYVERFISTASGFETIIGFVATAVVLFALLLFFVLLFLRVFIQTGVFMARLGFRLTGEESALFNLPLKIAIKLSTGDREKTMQYMKWLGSQKNVFMNPDDLGR